MRLAAPCDLPVMGRLAVLVFAIALAVSRFGLVLHELVGHGVTAAALGADVTGWHLYVFGGGWLGFERATAFQDGEAFAVYLGGIAVELVVAAALAAFAARRDGVARLAIGGAAWALALHAGWYLAAGTFHGFGDGWLLHQRLGAGARGAVVAVTGAAIVIGAFVAGRRVAGALRRLAPASTPRRQLAVIAAALGLGLAGHAALTFAELRLRPDVTYGLTMRTSGERAVDRELAITIARAEEAGAPLDRAAVARARRALAKQHRQAPVGAVLLAGMLIAAVIGAARSVPAEAPSAPSTRSVVTAGAVAAASIALVMVLAALAP